MNSFAQQQKVVETCAASSMCHGPGALAALPVMPAAAPVASTGPQMMAGVMGMGLPAGMGWPSLGDMSSPAAAAMAAAAAAAPGLFASMTGGAGPLAAMGWGAQPMPLQMPSMGMQPFPGAHAQCAPAMSMPTPAFPAPSGVFNQQASMALPPSSVPSPAFGSTGETCSLQCSADNAKPPCCGGTGGPTCSGGRQQADSSNKACVPPPVKAPQMGGRGGEAGMAGGELSDFAISDSEDEDEVGGRRPGAGGHRGGNHGAQQHHFLGDVVALHDVGDDNGLMVCQVPGCGKDLSNLKEYHQRYRICDVHIKLQQVGGGRSGLMRRERRQAAQSWLRVERGALEGAGVSWVSDHFGKPDGKQRRVPLHMTVIVGE
jgi:hypothetical protein